MNLRDLAIADARENRDRSVSVVVADPEIETINCKDAP
jgi:hypothetical protein